MEGVFGFTMLVLCFQWAYTYHEPKMNPPNKPILKYPFEGVDYEYLPEKYQKQTKDCYAYYTRCIRDRNDLHVVCGLNTLNGALEDFPNQCQIDFLNCQNSMSKGFGATGLTYKDYFVAYNGDGNKCAFYFRAANGDPDEAVRIYKRTLPMVITDKQYKELKDMISSGSTQGNIPVKEDSNAAKDSLIAEILKIDPNLFTLDGLQTM